MTAEQDRHIDEILANDRPCTDALVDRVVSDVLARIDSMRVMVPYHRGLRRFARHCYLDAAAAADTGEWRHGGGGSVVARSGPEGAVRAPRPEPRDR